VFFSPFPLQKKKERRQRKKIQRIAQQTEKNAKETAAVCHTVQNRGFFSSAVWVFCGSSCRGDRSVQVGRNEVCRDATGRVVETVSENHRWFIIMDQSNVTSAHGSRKKQQTKSNGCVKW
jgi:hypothetical protein